MDLSVGGMIPASVNRACDTYIPLDPTPILESYPTITASPPVQLVHQRLAKRVDATCGFSGDFFFGCPINSYCIYNSGYGRFDCCEVDDSSSIAPDCDLGQTTCYASSQSLEAYGTGECGSGVACCPEAQYPSCVTAILSVSSDLSYSSFFCSQIASAFTITPMEQYVQQATTVSFITTSEVTVSVSPPSEAESPPQATGSPGASGTSSGVALEENQSTWEENRGAIIGGVVGGVVLIALIALGFFIRHRMKVKRREAGLFEVPELSGRVVGGSYYSIASTSQYNRSGPL